jgi:hypothetical protein
LNQNFLYTDENRQRNLVNPRWNSELEELRSTPTAPCPHERREGNWINSDWRSNWVFFSLSLTDSLTLRQADLFFSFCTSTHIHTTMTIIYIDMIPTVAEGDALCREVRRRSVRGTAGSLAVSLCVVRVRGL